MGHRWSGFPGAWCLDCGIECPEEVCMASCPDSPDPGKPVGYSCPDPAHHSGPCPEPGSNRHNPYRNPAVPDDRPVATLDL